MSRIRAAIWETLKSYHPMTVRQTFYQLTTQSVIAKTEAEYKTTVVRLLVEMRLAGDIPFDWIADNTRWMRKPRTFSSMEAALQNTARTYRRAPWDNQDVYVEIWTGERCHCRRADGRDCPVGRSLDGVAASRQSPTCIPRPKQSSLRASRRSCITSATTIRVASRLTAKSNNAYVNSHLTLT